MSNIYDEAVLAWCNDQLENAGLPRDATGISFGYEIGCYSEYTHEYSVTAEIDREDGSSFTTFYVWGSVLEALPEYVAAYEAMNEEHDRSCYSYEDGD
jgi:hypothetical protein